MIMMEEEEEEDEEGGRGGGKAFSRCSPREFKDFSRASPAPTLSNPMLP